MSSESVDFVKYVKEVQFVILKQNIEFVVEHMK